MAANQLDRKSVPFAEAQGKPAVKGRPAHRQVYGRYIILLKDLASVRNRLAQFPEFPVSTQSLQEVEANLSVFLIETFNPRTAEEVEKLPLELRSLALERLAAAGRKTV